MKIESLGGAQEIGKSAFLVSDKKTNIILDYGIQIQTIPPQYPLKAECDAVILSHAHLDHSGSLPILYKKYRPPLFTNDVTLDSTLLLIKDSMKIARKQHYKLPFSKNDVKRMFRSAKLLNYYEDFHIGDFSCSLYDAGHIPGSAGILLKNRGKSIFYTGDIKLDDTRLLNGCTLPKEVDVLITESTYSEREHPNREKEERRFISAVEEAIALEETALIPVFAIGRAQEVLLILENYVDKIALDGMAKPASEIILHYGYYLKDHEKLKSILNRVMWIKTDREREKAVKKIPIIVTTAAMMGGGPVLFYLRELRGRPEAKILFTGYLIEDSPARILTETGIFQSAEEKFHVHCDLKQFDLSSHCGRSELLEIIRRTNPKKVVCVHGDKCEKFAKEISEIFDIETIAPRNGDALEV